MDNPVEEHTTQVRPPVLPDDVAPGAIVGDIQLGDLVASGVSSEVFKGINLIARKHCAVKILHRNLETGSVARGRYTHEAKQVAAIANTAVADVYGFGHTQSGRLYAISEWVEGHSLREVVRRNAPLSRRSLMALLREVCTAMGAVHAAGFAHRRLHGGNILVQWSEDTPPRVKLLDFGVWHVHPPLDEASDERPAEQAFYLAPEIAKGEPGDSRTDLYALGVLLYEMVTGKVPFLAGTFAATLEQHVNDQVPPPSQIANVPPDIEETILRALEKEPRRRIPSMEALLGAFDPFLATGQHRAPSAKGKVRALTTGELRLEEAEQTAVPTLPRPSKPPTFEEPLLLQPAVPVRKQRRWIFIGLAAALLFAAGGVAYVLLGQDEEDAITSARPAATKRTPRRTARRRLRRQRPRRIVRPPVTRPPAKGTAPAKRPATAPAATPPPVAPRGKAVVPNNRLRARSPLSPIAGAHLPLDRLRLRRNRDAKNSKQFGTVTLTSVAPDAQFFLDGRFVGKGQRRVLRRIPAGKHRLHAVVNGRKSPVRQIDLQAGQRLTLGF